jgi:cytochrome P450
VSDSNGNGRLPAASLVDAPRFVLTGLLPALVRGLFSPRKGAMKLLTALDADGHAVSTLRGIREKTGGEGARLLGGRIVTLWGRDAIREVLDRSAYDYASDAGAKGKGMAHFQPDALTVSRGEKWEDRRRFNESVLATKERLHPDAKRFLEVVADEVDRLRIGPELEWGDFERLFDRITLRVVFGDRARGDQELTDLLEELMGEANRLVGLSHDDEFYELYGRIEKHLADAEPGSLAARAAEAPQTDKTRVAHQVPHWLFAMRDTLGANAYRALAVTVAHPEAYRRVREEVDGADLTDPGAIDGMRYLEGCLQEAMRLWPTVPMIAREATRETTLAGTKVDEGTQVMILNTFNHRDPDEVEGADRLVPERWADGDGDYKFNHLSNGTQYCPGATMVLLLGKAVLAQVVAGWTLGLREPEIDPSEPLPHMLDFFSTRFAVEPR